MFVVDNGLPGKFWTHMMILWAVGKLISYQDSPSKLFPLPSNQKSFKKHQSEILHPLIFFILLLLCVGKVHQSVGTTDPKLQ